MDQHLRVPRARSQRSVKVAGGLSLLLSEGHGRQRKEAEYAHAGSVLKQMDFAQAP